MIFRRINSGLDEESEERRWCRYQEGEEEGLSFE